MIYEEHDRTHSGTSAQQTLWDWKVFIIVKCSVLKVRDELLNSTCCYCFCGISYNEMFAIVFKQSEVVKWSSC